VSEPSYVPGTAIGARSTWRDRLVPLGCALLPGALAGVQLAGLLFFLNPHWPFEAAPVARATAYYSSLLSVTSALVLLPFTWGRPARARRALPWSLFVVFLTAGLVFWVHASAFSFYLPVGINRRLIKAALWLSLAAVATFYTALVHSIRRRPYSRRSALLLVVVAALAVYVVLERRDAFRPPVAVTPRPSSVAPIVRPNLLVVGLGSGSLDVVLPLAEQGQLPFFGALLRDGAYGRLTTVEPTRPLPLWTSLATGKYPYQPGVVAAHRYHAPFLPPGSEFHLTPLGLAFEHWGLRGGALPTPLRSDSLTVWTLCERLGISTAVLGWPGATGGFAPKDDPARGVEASAPSNALVPSVEALQAFGAEVLAAASLDGERGDAALRELDRAAQDGRPHALFVALEGLEAISVRTFGAYSAVHFEGLQKQSAVASSAALEGYYAHLDEVLDGLWRRLPAPRLVLVVSPYGVHETRGPRRLLGLFQRERRFEGQISSAPDGLFLLRGHGVRPGFVNRVGLTDVVPTVLYGLGFPVALDFDGRVVTEAFDPDFLRRNPLTFVPSYETMIPLSAENASGAPRND
jgi:hypothetical protein